MLVAWVWLATLKVWRTEFVTTDRMRHEHTNESTRMNDVVFDDRLWNLPSESLIEMPRGNVEECQKAKSNQWPA